MAKHRMIDTDMWDDDYIDDLSPHGKLAFFYFLSNLHTNLAGCYKITRKRIAANTGLEVEEVDQLLADFERDKKIIFRDGWLLVRNFVGHQKLCNPKIRQGVIAIALDLPSWARDTLLMDYPELSRDIDSQPHSNSDLDSDSNLDSEIDEGKAEAAPLPTPADPDPRVAAYNAAKPLRDEICKGRGKKGKATVITLDEWASITRVFESWKSTFGKTERAKLTAERGRCILDRLRPPNPYTVEEIELAILGCKNSPYHNGTSGESNGYVYDDLDLICRDDTYLEKFIGHGEASGNGNGRANGSGRTSIGGVSPAGKRADEIIRDSDRFQRPQAAK